MIERTLSEIVIYPIKSLGGISLNKATINATGLEYDRRWMLVDKNRKFITQRQFNPLSMINLEVHADGLAVNAPNMTTLHIPFVAESENIEVEVWRDRCLAVFVGKQYDDWFSDYLSVRCQLVYMPNHTKRMVDSQFAISKDNQVSFADGYPFLIISEASLSDLNRRLVENNSEPIPMKRFRPNLVIKNEIPYEEDHWKHFKISNSHFHVVKPCSRCVIPTINTDTGKKEQEPTRTLMRYRKRNNKLYFGQNCIHDYIEGQTLNLDDAVQITQ